MERDKSIDIAKGIGILLVVLGHVPSIPYELKKVIYSFHMPLFFFISGYLYNVKKYNSFTVSEFVKSRIKKFILPYFTIGFICYILFGVLYPLVTQGYSINFLKQSIKFLLGLIYSWGAPHIMAWSSPLWFLTCIFIAEILLFLTFKYSNKEYFIFLILGAVGYLYTLITKFRLPWNADVALTAVCFMYIGHIFRRYDIIKKMYNVKYFIVSFLVLSFSIVLNQKIDFNLRTYGNILLTYCSGISGSIIILQISKSIKKSSILEFFGENSLYMMGFTYSILNVVAIINNNINLFDNFIVNFIVQVIILSTLVWAIVKSKQAYKSRKKIEMKAIGQ